MKVLILAALVATCYGRWWASTDQTDDAAQTDSLEFKAGKEYIYAYKSQVLTGIPAFSKSYGGIKLECKVKLNFDSSLSGTLQMDEIEILTLNHEVQDSFSLPPTKQLSRDQFTALPSDQKALVLKKLRLPIKFTLNQGLVTEVQISTDEVNWSLDIKRSVLAIFQVRLQSAEETINEKLTYNSLEDDNSTAFMALEPSLEGTCYTKYQAWMPVDGDKNHYRILKTRDPVHCIKFNSVQKTTFSQDVDNCKCDDNLESKPCTCKPVNAEYEENNPGYFGAPTIGEYLVASENDRSVLIKRFQQSAVHKYRLSVTPEQYISTLTNQTLQLVEEKDTQTIEVSSLSWRSISEPWKNRLLEDDEESPMMSADQILAVARSLRDEMVAIAAEPTRFEDHLTVFYQLVEILRICKKQQIETLFRDVRPETDYKKWKVIVDALAHVNKTVADDFLLTKIANGEIPNLESSAIFVIWAADKVPSPAVLDKMSSVLSTLQGKTNMRQAYQHGLLCFGAMVRRMINSEHIMKHQCVLQKDKKIHEKNIEGARKYEKVIEGLLSSARNDEDKILILKALTNLESIDALPQIQGLISKSESLAVRVHAIYALKGLCHQNRVKVLETLAPLCCTNRNEDSEIRMASFVVSMECDAGIAQLHNIINEEQDLDFKTFVVKYLRSMIQFPGSTRTDLLKLGGARFSKRVHRVREVLKKVKSFQMSADSEAFQLRYGLTEESDGELFRVAYFTNQTSKAARTGMFQHNAILRGKARHYFEIGYRAENFEKIMSKLADKRSSIRSHADMSIMDSMKTHKRVEPGKASLTIYLRINGQQASFIHLDEDKLNQYLMQVRNNGQLSVPVRLFQTAVMKPEQSKRLQAHGMWQIQEKGLVWVVDMDGYVNITLSEKNTPVISFESTKPVRMENKVLVSQYVKAGFAKTGVTSAINARVWNKKSDLWRISLIPQNMTFNYTTVHPTDVVKSVEVDAYTNTFVLPMRLPKAVTMKDVAFKDLSMVEPERKTFDFEIDQFQSVDLKAKVHGDINLPELYSFVRDRHHLLPTCVSLRKQNIKLSITPASGSNRVYTFLVGMSNLTTPFSAGMRNPYAIDEDDSSEETGKRGYISAMFRLWDVKKTGRAGQESSESSSSESSEEFLGSESLGTMNSVLVTKLMCQTPYKTKEMVANFTTQYEHDFPTVKSILSCERPPIVGKERENVQLIMKTTINYDPSMGNIIKSHKITWGERSSSKKAEVKIAGVHSQVMKDGDCFEHTVYGCKDQFGVVYPIWYNNSMQITSKNTDLPRTLLTLAKRYHMNIAQSVFVMPASDMQIRKSMKQADNDISISLVVRPLEGKVDALYAVDGLTYNFTRMWLPVESGMTELLFSRPAYPLGQMRARSSNGLPRHHKLYPYSSRDVCIVDHQQQQITTLESKTILLPQTDCEIVLAGDCSGSNTPKQRLITYKTSSEEKKIKVYLGQTKLELKLRPASVIAHADISLKVNDRVETLNRNDRCEIKDDGEVIAILSCDDNNECELRSDRHQLYMKIDTQLLKVEVDDSLTQNTCGLCGRHPEVLGQTADATTSVMIFKNNRVNSEQCTMREDISPRPCQKIYKHKVVHATSAYRNKMCISVDRLPKCSDACPRENNDNTRPDEVDARCLTQEEMKKEGIRYRIQGGENVIDETNILSKIGKYEKRRVQLHVPISCN